jgi:hypothetical protein
MSPPQRSISVAELRQPAPSSALAIVLLGALLALLLAGCQGGLAEGLRTADGRGLLGGRHTDPPAPIGPTLPQQPPPQLGEPWRPPLLADLEAWMPQRPGQPPLVLPPLAPPTDAGTNSPYPVMPVAYAGDKLQPSNDRDWVPEHTLLAWAELNGDNLTVHNVRNCEFYSYRDCLVDHYDRTYRLSELRSVDFLVVPFNGAEALAHTMLSFGFANGDYLGVSVEVRLEKGEEYHPVNGLLKQFEIIYVVADERDLIRVRTEHRDCDVLAYRSKATPAQARALLLDIMNRVNTLHDNPEFYDTLSNNCTTNIVRHINRLAPDRVPYDYRVLLPGFADHLAYELGLIDNSVPFAELRRHARLNDQVARYRDSEQFSTAIRGETVLR